MQIQKNYTYSFPNMINNLNFAALTLSFTFHCTSTAIHIFLNHWCVSFKHGLLVLNTSMYTPWVHKSMATHSSTLAWKIPWMEEPGRLQSMGSLRVGHDWASSLSLCTFMHWRRKWQPTPVFLPGESHWREPGGLTSMGSHRVGHDWSDLAAAAAYSLRTRTSIYITSTLSKLGSLTLITCRSLIHTLYSDFLSYPMRPL